MQYEKGSEWRKWDLHFHTLSSYDYKDKSITNQDIIDKLYEENISVVAITDHHIIDTIRIKELQELGKDKITILPGIEFLSDARGSEPIHFIGIFDENSNIEHIWGQIKNKTDIFKIEGENKKEHEVYCDLKDTISLIHELGGISTIHAGKKSNSIDCITNSLPHAIAQKKDIANMIDIFELGKEIDINNYINIVFKHISYVPMIICSDNHGIKNYKLKQNCWIKANPTFKGLLQAINEPKDRFFIGEIPPKNQIVTLNKHKYIKQITIEKTSNSTLNDIWFDNKLLLNQNLVTIIGNKGNGKSALADILALCGNARFIDDTEFSFLNKKKFKKHKLAENFNATLLWEDETHITKKLSDNLNTIDVEKVKYLPQKYIETICENEYDKFQEEINKVVFSHILESEKLGEDSLHKLIKLKTNSIHTKREQLKVILRELSEKKITLLIDYGDIEISKIKNLIIEKDKEIAEHKKYKDENIIEVIKPENDENVQDEQRLKFKKIERFNSHLEKLNIYLDLLQENINNFTLQKNTIINSVQNIELQIEEFNNFKDELDSNFKNSKLEINIHELLSISYNKKIIEIESLKIEDKLKKFTILKEKTILIKEKKQLKINNLNTQLNEVQKQYQSYISTLSQWDKANKELLDQNLKFKNKIKFKNENLPNEIKNINKSMFSEYKKLFNTFNEELKIYEELYKPVLEFVEKEKEKRNSRLKGFIEFTTNIAINKKVFTNKILDFFDNRRKKFNDENIKSLIDSDFKIDFKNIIKLNLKIEKIIQEEKNIDQQFRDSKKLINFYMSLWDLDSLSIEYDILLDRKKVSELSPGERGALLIIFYLLIDKSDIPLIVDQPEDNLDNESVFEYLVPYIKSAKQRRQIIIVTHNPNIAVVSDAEQIIYTEIDKTNKNKIKYISGAIEDDHINKKIVEVLEGTMPAFNNRTVKYFK